LLLLLLLFLLLLAAPGLPGHGFGARNFDVGLNNGFFLREIQNQLTMLASRRG
jgi:hypothetical protein